MKKITAICAALILVFSITAMTGCGSSENSENSTADKAEVTVLAAASLTDALNDIITEYEKDSNYKITPSYAGSGDLVQQIEGGAPCDIFISASTVNYIRGFKIIIVNMRQLIIQSRFPSSIQIQLAFHRIPMQH